MGRALNPTATLVVVNIGQLVTGGSTNSGSGGHRGGGAGGGR